MLIIQFRRMIPKSFLCLVIFVLSAVCLIAQTPKDEELKQSQIKNQEAQAKYYETLSENSGNFWIAYSTPITTVIGVLITVLTLTIQNRNNRRLESDKWNKARKDDLAKWRRLRNEDEQKRIQEAKAEIRREARKTVGDVIGKIAKALHSMTYVAWMAKNDIEHFSVDLAYKHDDLMTDVKAEIIAGQVILASLDKRLYEKTVIVVKLTFSYDVRLALAVKNIDESDRQNDFSKYEKDVQKVGRLWQELFDFMIDLPAQFVELIDVKSDS